MNQPDEYDTDDSEDSVVLTLHQYQVNRLRIQNKAARVIQLKFFDWFYKPIDEYHDYDSDDSVNPYRRWCIRNKAARVIQWEFYDWFYKPICKDGTYGIEHFNMRLDEVYDSFNIEKDKIKTEEKEYYKSLVRETEKEERLEREKNILERKEKEKTMRQSDYDFYWDYVSKVSCMSFDDKIKYLNSNYSLREQTMLSKTRLFLELKITEVVNRVLYSGFHQDIYPNLLLTRNFRFVDFNDSSIEFHIKSFISNSTIQGKKKYDLLLTNEDRLIYSFVDEDIFHNYEIGYHLTWEYQEHSNLLKQNKAARVIQCKFLDWFYKPICKDGTFGLNCLLAKRMCN
jgi:hypothetical protein